MNVRCVFAAYMFVFSAAATVLTAAAAEPTTQANVTVELKFTAETPVAHPFSEVTLDVLFTQPDGTELKVPAFWAGGQEWRVRYASPQTGEHRWRSESAPTQIKGLHGKTGTIAIKPYHGDNPLFKHGPIRIAKDQRHFEYADGTPFFWLGDTWWMGLSHRLHWPADFQTLAADRKTKGFTVVQIVAGLYPDMPPFDPRGANENGFPWETDFAQIRPEYFDAADRRLNYLVEQGLAPCLVGAWGYFMPLMGADKAQAHWRYLIARYGSLPIVWCAAGEGNLPYYLTKGFPFDDREQVHGWTAVLRSIRATDPWRRPLTIHPTAIQQYTARHATDDPGLLDFDMLQTPHGQREAVPVTLRAMHDSYAAKPTMPVVDGEASYEMLGDSLPTRWTRAMFWLCLTNGAAGHTYGANGIWQVNRRGDPHGASPHGGNYGKISWDEAMKLPGSTQVALGKKFFESLPWTELVPLRGAATWAGEAETGALGDWIWFPDGEPSQDAPVEPRYFRRAFDLPERAEIKSATLRLTADDKFTVWINGNELGSLANWRELAKFDVAKVLQPGKNIIAVRGENLAAPVKANPAGLIAGLEWTLADGGRDAIRTDGDWRVAKRAGEKWRDASFDDTAWDSAKIAAKQGAAPWGAVGGPSHADPPQVCGIGDTLRVVYALDPEPIRLSGLRAKVAYQPTLFDPVSGERKSLAQMVASGAGVLALPAPALDHDWVLLLELK
ncbi:MAG TPA: DUF4038 domain-containing protein [Pirellulales bacterium]|nr:DUF4038 domain-containing protein [Pirellulales bacterium]